MSEDSPHEIIKVYDYPTRAVKRSPKNLALNDQAGDQWINNFINHNQAFCKKNSNKVEESTNVSMPLPIGFKDLEPIRSGPKQFLKEYIKANDSSKSARSSEALSFEKSSSLKRNFSDCRTNFDSNCRACSNENLRASNQHILNSNGDYHSFSKKRLELETCL
jgi:hypothetical protein